MSNFEISNAYDQNFKIPLFIDLPIDLIKESIFYFYHKNSEGFRFIPQHLRIIAVKGN